MNKILCCFLFLTMATFGRPTHAQEVFLDGFPDVPLLEGVTELTEERIVFDTLGGTVAQTELSTPTTAKETITRYSAELPTFGWECTLIKHTLRCNLEGNLLLITDSNPNEKPGRIILRLEPTK